MEDADEYAAQVFASIAERAQNLGKRYPFDAQTTRLTYLGPKDLAEPYLVLLALTIAHAYALPTGFDVPHYFEKVLTRALTKRGLTACNVWEARQSVGNLYDAVRIIGRECAFNVTPEAAVIRTQAQEEGVDVVAHFEWGDTRPAHWAYIFQATCARSDAWPAKLMEPSEDMWRKMLGLYHSPRALLAVPHHVSAEMLAYLAERDSDRMVLDRLRLCYPPMPIQAEDEVLLGLLKGDLFDLQ